MIEIVSYPSDPRSVKLAAIIGRRAGVAPEVEAAARDILAQVREGGDEALCALTRKFDKVEMQPKRLRMSGSIASCASRLRGRRPISAPSTSGRSSTRGLWKTAMGSY